ncbi:MAG: SIS domain-containing protein [Ilumatobacteraceae bacterium]
MKQMINDYAKRLSQAMSLPAIDEVPRLADAFRVAWGTKKSIYLCGNGGSAGNANHLANDFTYGAGVKFGIGLRVESLSANPSTLTCLANDIGYENIYSEQLRVKADAGDVLVVFSGSGNSANVVKALEMGNKLGMHTFAVLGYSGGKCKQIAQHPVHFAIDDMQIAEDLQLIIGHMIMQWLCEQGPTH